LIYTFDNVIVCSDMMLSW